MNFVLTAIREQAVSVKLPFLSVRRRVSGAPVPVDCPGASGCALAFTTLIDVGSFLQLFRASESEFELELIFRQSVDKYLDELEAAGFHGVGFDATHDQATTFSIADLRRMFE